MQKSETVPLKSVSTTPK